MDFPPSCGACGDGDKTQLLAIAFACKFRRQTVMWGVFVATAANHLMAAAAGSYLAAIVPMAYIKAGSLAVTIAAIYATADSVRGGRRSSLSVITRRPLQPMRGSIDSKLHKET